jgi:succinate dehydrogenase/fumarate reductase flavoprotein subunit
MKDQSRIESADCCTRINTLIIGSGAAALNAAIQLWESGNRDILVVTEQWGGGTSNHAGSDKQTYYKLSLDPGISDSAYEMALDICRGGAMHGDIALCEAQYSVPAFYHLVSLGVPFPHDEFGAYPGYKTDHDPRSRATSAGPLTSHLMFGALARKVEKLGIPVHDRVMVFELLTDDDSEGSRIVGAAAIQTDRTGEPDHGLIIYLARQVILATGGPAGMYRDSVYPPSQIGSTGMALKAGAKAQNLHLSQFGIASVKFRWNLSGSYQQVVPRYFSTAPDGSDPKEFLVGRFPDDSTLFGAIFLKGYQWPFDPTKVDQNGSSNLDLLIQYEKAAGRRVFIDYTRNPSGFSHGKLPPEARSYLEKSDAIAETPIERLRRLNQPAIDLYLDHGIDLSAEPLEIAVCAQHCNGGLTGDIWWESSIRGLFPIGEVNGSHGIARPGGSALNAGQVGGIRAAMKIWGYQLPVTSDQFSGDSDRSLVTGHRSLFISFIDSLVNATGSLDYRTALAELRTRMSDHAGPVRNPDTIGEEVMKARALWDRLHTDLKRFEINELQDVLRVFDLCLTHMVYLEAIAEDLYSPVDKMSHILEISLDKDLRIKKKWVPVRPVPKKELWFENVWKEYRNKLSGFGYQVSDPIPET